MVFGLKKIIPTIFIAYLNTFSPTVYADEVPGKVADAGECKYGQPSVAGGDVTGNGLEDIVTGDRDGVFLIMNLGNNRFSKKKFIAKPGELDYAQPIVAIGDLTGNGNNDVLFANSEEILLSENKQGGNFAKPYRVAGVGTLRYGQPSISIADVDNDGKKDFIVGNRDGIIVYVNKGNGKFAPIKPAENIVTLNNTGKK